MGVFGRLCGLGILVFAIAIGSTGAEPAQQATLQSVVQKYCITCHSDRLHTASLSLEKVDPAKPYANAEVWERVIAKLRAGSMPPAGSPRPDAATYRTVSNWLESEIDKAAASNPNPGRVHAVQRLNRVEYNNAIRDLLSLNLDVASQLPGDETSDGSFDNLADVLSISTAHLERYLSVARQVTRLAVGLPPKNITLETYEIPLHTVQDDRQSEDLPFGSRGGVAARHNFPADGEYLIKVRLRRQYQDYLMGMGWAQQLDVRLDGKLLKRFTVGGDAKGRAAAASYAGDGEPGFAGDPEWERYMQTEGDAGLEIRLPISAGPHVVSASFVRQMWQPEGLPQPHQRGRVITNDEIYMDHASVAVLQIGGPYHPASSPKDTPSRRTIFVCQPKTQTEEKACATKILSRLARLAYRRPVTDRDTQTLLEFFTQGRQDGGSFDSGIQFALERLLVDPDFLLRLHRDPPRTAASPSAYRLSDLEIASRLSFFLWSSIPDERLLDLAERGQLAKPAALEQEVKRMLADRRATDTLVGNFAAQWLNLRRVSEILVDPNLYPDFDNNLLDAFRTETELFIASTLEEDRPVKELLTANYTFVNERLARQYGIPGIYGNRFRRITLPDPNRRGGLLGEGALLAANSYPNRTSPVLRGKFLLNNLFGLPVPPPPPGVDTNLDSKPGAAAKSMRERLSAHRENPTCASCHSLIDPLGYALENFDALGGWRTADESGTPVDSSGSTVNGTTIQGLAGLRELLIEDPEQFPRTLTEKLMTYALGRRIEYYDQPAIRGIVRASAAQDYKWSALILGIVKSPAFQMRTPAAAN